MMPWDQLLILNSAFQEFKCVSVELWHHRRHQMFLMNLFKENLSSLSHYLQACVCELESHVCGVKMKGAST